MGCLNVDDKWFDDPRRDDLIERIGQTAADGTAMKMWRLAETYFRKDSRVPRETFFSHKHAKDFLAAKLAEERPDGVYIKGSKEFFQYIADAKEGKKKAGETRAANAERDGNGRFTSRPPAEHQQEPADTSSHQQEPASLSLSLSLSSSSVLEDGGDADAVEANTGEIPGKYRATTECLWDHPDLREFLEPVPIAGQKAWVTMVGTRFLIEPELHRARAWWVNNSERRKPGDTVARFVNGWLNGALEKQAKEKPEAARDAPTAAYAPTPGFGGGLKACEQDKADMRAAPADPKRVREIVARVTGKM